MNKLLLVLLLSGCASIPDLDSLATKSCSPYGGVKRVTSYFGTKVLITCRNGNFLFDGEGNQIDNPY